MAENASNCAVEDGGDTIQFVLIIGCSVVALFGVCCNMLLLWIFVKKLKSLWQLNQFFYQTLLAVMDITICAMYMALFFVRDVLMYKMKIEWLLNVYFSYSKGALYLSIIVQFCIPFILVLATIERWIYISAQKHRYSFVLNKYTRLVQGVSLVVIAAILRHLPYHSVKVKDFENCSDVILSKQHEEKNTTLWTMQLHESFEPFIQGFQVFVPFVILIGFNIRIVRKLRNMHNEVRRKSLCARDAMRPSETRMNDSMTVEVSHAVVATSAPVFASSRVVTSLQGQLSAERRKLKSATWTMLIICLSYIIVNSLAVAMFIWERSLSEDDPLTSIYIYASDVLNILVTMCSAFRPVVYYKFNYELRGIINNVLGLKQSVDATTTENIPSFNFNNGVRGNNNHQYDQSPIATRNSRRFYDDSLDSELDTMCPLMSAKNDASELPSQ